jgi:hypothetical protein
MGKIVYFLRVSTHEIDLVSAPVPGVPTTGCVPGRAGRFVTPVTSELVILAVGYPPERNTTLAYQTSAKEVLQTMAKIGYFLSCEEWGPAELLERARMAEEAGFEALWISDHYHPWNDEQGQSPFVWSVIGGLSQATSLPVPTGVTCPTVRIHPAIIAQAAATSKGMLNGSFSLGVGTGENLNEHILGDRWPQTNVRRSTCSR